MSQGSRCEADGYQTEALRALENQTWTTPFQFGASLSECASEARKRQSSLAVPRPLPDGFRLTGSMTGIDECMANIEGSMQDTLARMEPAAEALKESLQSSRGLSRRAGHGV